MLLLSSFHSVCLTSVSLSFHPHIFHTAWHIEAIDVHWCLLCRHGFVMRSPGSWLGGSRVSALRLFCLAPLGHHVMFGFELLLQGWPAQDGAHKLPGHYVSSLLLDMSFHFVMCCFWWCFCVFVFLFGFVFFVFVACLCWVGRSFLFSPWNGIILTCTTNQEACYSIGFTCSN